jgi:hypothetical protein
MVYCKAAQLNAHRPVEGICTFLTKKSSNNLRVVLSFQNEG